MTDSEQPSRVAIRVDPVACDGIGMCAHVAPGVITLDTWGFPIVGGALTRRGDLRAARAAAAGCPRRALILEHERPPRPGPSPRYR